MNTKMALDRSSRRIDADGRLHVDLVNISKAQVSPYYGREIPLDGLEPDRVYQVLRPPAELKKGAATFNNMPLMSKHIIVSADDPKKEDIVGSLGTDAVFEHPHLKCSLVVWDADAIRAIEDGTCKEISCGYRYVAHKDAGVYEGCSYEISMSSIVANHVALVKEGRAGPDVVVADGKLGDVKMKFSAVKGKLAAKFATDEAFKADRPYLFLALDEMEEEVDGEDEECTEAEMEEKAKDKAKDKKAMDARAAKDKAARDKKARDKAAKDARRARDAETEQDRDAEEAEDESEEKRDDEDDEAYDARMKRARDRKAAKDKMDKAMDAQIEAAVSQAVKETERRLEAVAKAKAEVFPHVGQVSGLDSAEAVYKFALDAARVDTKDVHPSAFAAMVKMLPKPNSQTAPIAMDHKASGEVINMFPQLARYV